MIFGEFNLKKNLKEIETSFEFKEETIKKLQAENNKLREEAYKDKELSKMKDELETMREDYYRGFPISKEESEEIRKWCDKHIQEKHWNAKTNSPKSFGAIGGNFTYIFTPTSIGTIGEIRCTCGASFTFQDL